MAVATDIVVVGAGISGLYAAKLLKQRGLSVIVLEARDRVGGRMFSQKLSDGSAIDLGAQWISPDQKRIQALVREYKLETHLTHTEGNRIAEVGQRRKLVRSGSPFSWLATLDLLQASWRIERNAKKLDKQLPWQHPQAKQLDSQSFQSWLEKITFSEEARTYWHYIAGAGMCTNVRDFSPLEVFHQIATIGGLEALEKADSIFLKEGTQAIAQQMANELGECLYLSTPVRAIQTNKQHIQITTDNGSIQANRILLALPPQLLEKIAFDSDVENYLQTRVRHSVLGKVVKSVVVYERAWWRDRGLSGAADTPSEIIETLADTSIGEASPGVLVAITSGDHAVQLSQMDDESKQAVVLAHIDNVLGKSPSPPQQFFSMDWIREPYSLGGYASRQGIGGWTAQKNPLAQPFGRIHFAGTETATEWRSYMEGALQSAERASQEICHAVSQI